MKTRITITLDPAAHERAKRTASARKTSVSGLIESLIQSATAPEISSVVDRMIGSASLRNPAPAPDPRMDALRAKYLKP